MSTLNAGKVLLSSGLILPEYTTANLPTVPTGAELGLMVFDYTVQKMKIFNG